MVGRWWVPAAAAVAAVGVIGGAALWPRGGSDGPAAAPPAPTPTATGPADLLVRDWDRVAVTGEVLAVPGRPVRVCAPLAVGGVGHAPGQEPPPAYCDTGLTLLGLDLATLPGRAVVKGVTVGRARVEGVYRAGELTVQRLAAPGPEPTPSITVPERPPCPAPAGGWRPTGPPVEALAGWLRSHQDRYVDLYLTYPGGRPEGDRGPTGPTVPVVGAVGDPAAAETELRAAYGGNLCVVRVPRPGAALTRAYDRVTTDRDGWTAHQAFAGGIDVVTATVPVDLVVLDPAAKRWLTQLDDRSGVVAPRPWVRPLG